jgi:orotidine-5'-phosphate decarboxylase
MTAIGELLLESLADEKAVVGIDGQVASIEESVEIRAKKESIADLMTSAVGIGPDVGSL